MDPTEELALLRAELKASQGRAESVLGRQRSILARATAAGRDMSAEEARQVDQLGAAFDKADAESEVIKLAIEGLKLTPMPRASAPNPIGHVDPSTPRPTPTALATFGRQARNHADVFRGRTLADPYAGRFSSLGEFALAVHAGNDSRLLRNSALTPMTTGAGQEGGFLVPQQMVQQLMDESLRREVVRPRAKIIPVTTGQAVAAGFSSLDRTGTKRAGLVLEWAGESTDLTHQKAKTREIALAAKKGSIFCAVSNELAADAPNFDAMLGEAMVSALAGGLDYAFIAGSGVGQPLGMLNGGCTIEVAKESGQAANTLLVQNLSKMVGRLSPESYGRAAWFIHPTVVPQLYQMSYVVKNVAGTENVGGAMVHPIAVGPDGALRCFGLPMIVTDACSVLSARGDVLLSDMTRYIVALRSEMSIKRDDSVYFGSDEIAFRLTIRLDGLPEDAEPTKLRDGTNTVSPIVTLQAR